MRPTISAALIVRNEQQRLAGCLDSIKPFVDEMIVIDTGSRDDTKTIALQYTDQVYDFAWNHDFAAARNAAIDHCNCDWILSIDADERLDCHNAGLIDVILANPDSDAVFLPLCCTTEEHCYERFAVLRLFSRVSSCRFAGSIHEQITLKCAERVAFAAAPVLWHLPAPYPLYQRKRQRNVAALNEALTNQPDNPFLHYYVGVEWLAQQHYEQALPYFKKVCGCLTREHMIFLAPAMQSHIACLKGLGRLREALALCMDYSLLYPEYTDLYYEGGIILEQLGWYKPAVRWLACALTAGMPPPVFSHRCGTEGFLSRYHLGCCYAQLGQRQTAQQHFEQVLTENCSFAPARAQLFSMLTHFCSGPEMYCWFCAHGHMNNEDEVYAMAQLFFEAGQSTMACKCLERLHELDCVPDVRAARYFLYGGRPEAAIDMAVRYSTELGEEQAEYIMALAWLFQRNLHEARVHIKQLWRCENSRSQALALLEIACWLERGTLGMIPELHRGEMVVHTLVHLLEQCSCFIPRSQAVTEVHDGYYDCLTATVAVLQRISAGGLTALDQYYQEKRDVLRQMANYRYREARGLFA